MQIRDIVSRNPEVVFANDVQLSWFPDHNDNARLARGYLFSGSSAPGKLSSAELLNKLRLAFLSGSENRLVVVATYGHGKSHLALAIANFFGKSGDAPEVAGILDNVSHAAGAPTAQNFRDFKDGRAPYLVVGLRGDQPQSLPQQFLRGLEDGLRHYPATQNAHLPFWFEAAETYLANLSSDQRARADECLRAAHTDLAGLRARVASRDPATYDLCRQVSRHVSGVVADFGGEISLQDAVERAADDFCGDDKPFAGILILFDEFSAFIERYSERRAAGASAASLQDLLNGVENRRGKAVFVAFSQHDPSTVARAIHARTGRDDSRDSLTKELERLPAQQRFGLHSALENVLDAYLKQDDDAWNRLIEQANATGTVEDATDHAMQLFPDRYDGSAWGLERVYEVITKGCFPLHPLTTALLCSVEFKATTAAPRQTLGFVLDAVDRKACEPAASPGGAGLNWVRAVELVDWFGEMLASGDEWTQYQTARQQVGPDAPAVWQAVLKAMLLHLVAGLRSGRLRYEGVLSDLCGFPVAACEQALREMRDANYVQYDDVRRVYRFWAGVSPRKAEEEMNRRVAAGKSLTPALLARFQAEVAKTERFKPVPVPGIEQGHPEDWACSQTVLPRADFSAETLRQLVPTWHVGRAGLVEGRRGSMVYVWAQTPDDVNWLHDNAQTVLASAFGNNPPPVVLALPNEARPNLVHQILCKYELEGWDRDTMEQVGGPPAVEPLKKQVERRLDNELKEVTEGVTYVVPPAYQAHVQLLPGANRLPTLLKRCYEAAYRFAVPNFFTQFKVDAPRLRSAVALAAQHLALDAVSARERDIRANPVANDLLDKFLQRSTSWGLLDVACRVRSEPASARLKQAWDKLDQTIAPGAGEVALCDALVPLLNPPFGYDVNHLALLFCAWWGHNRHDLQLSRNNRLGALEDVLPKLARPRDFFDTLCYVDRARVSRRDKNKEADAITGLIEQVNRETFPLADARRDHKRLQQFAANEQGGAAAGLRERAQAAAERLESGIDRADEYDRAADRILDRLRPGSAPATNVKMLTLLLGEVEKLPGARFVTPERPGAADLRAQVVRQLEKTVEPQCARWERLGQIADYSANLNNLQSLRTDLIEAGLSDLAARAQLALSRLNESKTALDAAQKDVGVRAEIEAMDSRAGLGALRRALARLDDLSPHADETRELQSAKRAALQQAQHNAVDFVQRLATRVDDVKTANDLRALRSVIERGYDRFADAPDEQRLVQAALDRCDALDGFFARLHILERTEARTPDDLNTAESQIADLQSAPFLSDVQRAELARARAALSHQARSKTDGALAWLRQSETQASAPALADPDALLRRLAVPPPFLPPDQHERVAELRAVVQRRVDEDEIGQVIRHFRRIADGDKRQECLRQLALLMAEEKRDQ